MRTPLSGSLFLTLSLLCPLAMAQGVDEFGAYGGRERLGQNESSRDFAVEIRVGPYLPNVDDEFDGGATPFRDVFGTKRRILFGLEVDWQALEVPDVLSFGPGVGLGYTAMGADAPLAEGSGRSDQATSLRLMPHWLVGVLRVDALDQKLQVPLIFTAKVGLAEAFWWARNGDKPARDADGHKARGRSYGYLWAVGAALNLSFLEPSRTRKVDAMTSVNRISLFGEYYGMTLDGFGSGGMMEVGDNSWTMGLVFEF